MVCGKVIYSNRKLATDAITKMGIKDVVLNKVNYSYFCIDCRGYHLASRKKRKYIKSKNASNQEMNFKKKTDDKCGYPNKRLKIKPPSNFKIK